MSGAVVHVRCDHGSLWGKPTVADRADGSERARGGSHGERDDRVAGWRAGSSGYRDRLRVEGDETPYLVTPDASETRGKSARLTALPCGGSGRCPAGA